MPRRRDYQIAWTPGLLIGVTAFVSGILLTRHFITLGPIPESVYEPSVLTLSGWTYYNAHTVPLSESANIFGNTATATGFDVIRNDSTSSYYKFLYVIPPLMTFIGGVLTAASFGRTTRLSYALLNGASVIIGYGISAAVGVFFFQQSRTVFGASGTLGPALIQSIAVAGGAYPAIFGGIGGLAYILASGSITISVR